MIETLVVKTPENWMQLLRDLHLPEMKRNFEISASHLYNPNLNGVSTSYKGFSRAFDKDGNFKEYGMRIDSEGQVIRLDLIAPVILPNPVEISFNHLESRDIEYALDFLQRFNDKGYKPSQSSDGLYVSTWLNRYLGAGGSMGC